MADNQATDRERALKLARRLLRQPDADRQYTPRGGGTLLARELLRALGLE
jgi:hypothetical protein